MAPLAERDRTGWFLPLGTDPRAARDGDQRICSVACGRSHRDRLSGGTASARHRIAHDRVGVGDTAAMTARGFTLIEALVSLLLTSILSVGLIETWRYAERIQRQSDKLGIRTQEVVAARRFLESTLVQASPAKRDATGHPNWQLSGATLEYLAPAPQASGAAGWIRYRVSPVRTPTGSTDLVLVAESESRLTLKVALSTAKY